jgi:hypothetical protein
MPSCCLQGANNANNDKEELDPLDAFMEDVGTAVKQDLQALAPEVARAAITANPALEKSGIKLEESMFEDRKVAAVHAGSLADTDMQEAADVKVKEEPEIETASVLSKKPKPGAILLCIYIHLFVLSTKCSLKL